MFFFSTSTISIHLYTISTLFICNYNNKNCTNMIRNRHWICHFWRAASCSCMYWMHDSWKFPISICATIWISSKNEEFRNKFQMLTVYSQINSSGLLTKKHYNLKKWHIVIQSMHQSMVFIWLKCFTRKRKCSNDFSLAHHIESIRTKRIHLKK